MSDHIPPERAAAVLTVELGNLQRNWRELAARAAPAECAGVVKADAYGLGAKPCAQALWAAGCRSFFVAIPQEGADLRAELPEATIFVLDGLLPGLATFYAGHRLMCRFLQGNTYEDARGRSFRDAYGYADDVPYRLGEVSLYGGRAAWSYGASVSTSQDVPFPFLKMDERENVLVSAFLDFRGNRLYANRTRHVMDNELRASVGTMFMETDATNLTVGLSGQHYEVYYRAWDARNTMEPRGGMKMPAVEQHLMPDLRLFSAVVSRERKLGRVTMGARVGLNRTGITDTDRMAIFEPFHPGAERVRWFVPFGLVAEYRSVVGAGPGPRPATARSALPTAGSLRSPGTGGSKGNRHDTARP